MAIKTARLIAHGSQNLTRELMKPSELAGSEV
jgi:hypothetical protein